ncbi:MAG: Hsp33 family molecular chaperone HslO [Myxococcales bacterium]|nr:Hsp33 family molecular chaperone HslO [Myxococcales bacterium]
MDETRPGDRVLRAMTDDGAFRVVTARTTDTVAAVLEAQGTSGRTGQLLGELVTGAILVRETMAPNHRVQGLLHGADERGRLVADVHPDGGSRGLCSADTAELQLEGGSLEMMRTLYTGELHRGVVAVPRGGGISEALMTYMASSEQVASVIAVACVLESGRVIAAGGYVVQLLPEVGRAPLTIMTERLRDFQRIDELVARLDAQPEPLLDELLYGMDFTRLDDSPLCFKCRCSAMRVMAALTSLGREQIQELIDEHRVIEMDCEYCGTQYAVPPAQLQGLLDAS